MLRRENRNSDGKNGKFLGSVNREMQETTVVKKPTITFKAIVEGEVYKYPMCGEVPPGYYKSVIEKVRETTTKSGKVGVEVCYKIEPFCQVYQDAKGKIDKGDKVFYYIKQLYIYGSPYFDNFVKAMTKHLKLKNDDEFNDINLMGIEEAIDISYNDYSEIGGIKQRVPYTFEIIKSMVPDDGEEDEDAEVNKEECQEVEEAKSPSIHKKTVNILDDDEFDDFLDEDDDEN